MRCRVKICGLTRPEDLRAAVRAGADYVGLVFAPGSPRSVRADDVAAWLEEERGAAEVVGVFRDQTVDEVLEIVHALDVDFVQLHGQEEGEAWRRLPVRLIETRLVRAGVVAPARFAGAAWAQLLDAGAGDGRRFDWTLAQGLSRAERLFVAGGLDAENVGEAVRRLRPFAVDVSSSLESRPGIKDADRLRRFVRAVREVDSN